MMKKRSSATGEDMASFCVYCGYCGTEIFWKGTGKRTGKRTWKRKRVVHINICQEPSILYFCNKDCKLNWIFRRPDRDFGEGPNGNWVNREAKPNFDMAEMEDNPEELEKFLKENKIKILREA